MNSTQDQPLTFAAAAFQVRNLFPTPVAVAPVNDAEALNAALTEVILARAGSEPSVCRSNAGGWQSRDDFATWCGPHGTRLLTAARLLADQMTGVQTEGGLARQAPVWQMNAWANVNAPGDSNHPHHHPGSFWSGVYWVEAGQGDAPETVGGEFEMHDPRGILPAFYAPNLRYALPGCLSAGLSDFIAPASGTLILFPSFLVHAVRPYRGIGRRISVAFNFSL